MWIKANKIISFEEMRMIESENDDIFTYFYKIFFGDCISSIEKVIDINLQFQWVDYIIYNKKREGPFFVDNKVRQKWYGDILLEEYSNFETKRLWWLLNDNILTDYIFYYIKEINTCYVFSHNQLKQFVENNYLLLEEKRLFSYNDWYRTSNFPVTIKELEDCNVDYYKITIGE